MDPEIQYQNLTKRQRKSERRERRKALEAVGPKETETLSDPQLPPCPECLINVTALPRKSLMIVIIDFDANQHYVKRDAELFKQVVESVVIFSNAHLMQSGNNKLVILSCSSYAVHIIYPEELLDSQKCCEYQMDEFAIVQSLTMLKLTDLLYQDIDLLSCQTNQGVERAVTALLPGTVGVALSYLSRCRREASKVAHIQGRILIISGSKEPSIRLANMHMNFFQAAARMGVAIDVCALELDTSYMLRHAADITGGFYYATKNFDTLSGAMLGLFLASPQVRHHINLPDQPQTDLRGVCFCHHQLINIGFACSSCLAVFCKYTPICGNCDAIFKPPEKLQMYLDKKAAQRRRNELSKARKREFQMHMS